jgi:hypothetical protein
MEEAATDSESGVTFSGLKPGNLYYVVAVFSADLQLGHHVEWSYGGGYGGLGSGNRDVPTIVRTELSWHQAIIAPSAGNYELRLDPSTADPEYCADVKPTFDPVTRTPFRSYRDSVLQPM